MVFQQKPLEKADFIVKIVGQWSGQSVLTNGERAKTAFHQDDLDEDQEKKI